MTNNEALIRGSIQRAIQESVAALIVVIVFTGILSGSAVGCAIYYGCLLILVAAGFIAGVVWSHALPVRQLPGWIQPHRRAPLDHQPAYAPLLRPIAAEGYFVFVIKLPYRLAPLESHKRVAVDRVHHVVAEHPEISRWVLSGHSLGGAIACRVARDDRITISALVLVGTTHPRSDNLASLEFPVTKVYGSRDGVAPSAKIQANKHLLPKHTRWVLIDGANHSQFAHYGHQLLDGTATISRNNQQDRTRTALLESLDAVTD